MTRPARTISCLAALLAVSWPASAADRERAPTLFEVQSDKRSASSPISLSRPFEEPHPGVATAIVAIHDGVDDAPDWLRTLTDLAAERGLADQVFVAAPQFLDESDIDPDSIDDILVARWTGGSWIDGATATGPTHILSYHVADSVLERLADPRHFPDLRQVTVAGFAEGADFVQRLALVSEAADRLEARGIRVRFAVGGASSFLRFGAERPTADGGSAVPPATRCERYNDWPFGPREAPQTLREQDKPIRFFAERYARRDVVALVGTLDTPPLPGDGCEAAAQGAGPVARLANHLLDMKNRRLEPDEAIAVPAVGHDPAEMFAKPPVFDLLLGLPTDAVRARLQATKGTPT